MKTLVLILLLSCACDGLVPSGAQPPPLPERQLTAETLLLREHISSRGAERTGNWWSRIDQDGCYTEAHNTWMWVMDPVLQRSKAWTLHWNGAPRLAPWFCLSPSQLSALKAAIARVPAGLNMPNAPGPVDRWTVVGRGRIMTAVVPFGAGAGGLQPVLSTLQAIAREGVWGRSPEPEVAATVQATAFLP